MTSSTTLTTATLPAHAGNPSAPTASSSSSSILPTSSLTMSGLSSNTVTSSTTTTTPTTASSTTSSISTVTVPSTSNTLSSGTLHLRAASSQRRIQWADNVIDNEGLGRKSSKACCIFHKTRAVNESSSSDSSSSDMDSDTESSSDKNNISPQLCQSSPSATSTSHRKLSGSHPGDVSPRFSNSGEASTLPRRARKYRPNAYEKLPRSARSKRQYSSHDPELRDNADDN